MTREEILEQIQNNNDEVWCSLSTKLQDYMM